jgi:hypothetical protein
MNSMGDIDNKQTTKQEIGHLQRIGKTNSLFLEKHYGNICYKGFRGLNKFFSQVLISLTSNDTNRQLNFLNYGPTAPNSLQNNS